MVVMENLHRAGTRNPGLAGAPRSIMRRDAFRRERTRHARDCAARGEGTLPSSSRTPASARSVPAIPRGRSGRVCLMFRLVRVGSPPVCPSSPRGLGSSGAQKRILESSESPARANRTRGQSIVDIPRFLSLGRRMIASTSGRARRGWQTCRKRVPATP